MKRTLRLLLALPVILALGAALVWGWLDATRVSAGGLPPLKTGDLVFQESGNTQSAAIALASRSLYTHVGIVEIDSQGRPFVVEAAGPVRTVALNDWIAHGTAGRITVKRVKGLDDVQARKAIAAAHVYDGRPYDVYFTDDRETLYCSELVHLAFKEGAGLELGAGQRVKDLHIGNAAVRRLIEARWRQHPLCRDGKAGGFQACYARILEQRLVTPASVARDAKLETVFSNFGAAAE